MKRKYLLRANYERKILCNFLYATEGYQKCLIMSYITSEKYKTDYGHLLQTLPNQPYCYKNWKRHKTDTQLPTEKWKHLYIENYNHNLDDICSGFAFIWISFTSELCKPSHNEGNGQFVIHVSQCYPSMPVTGRDTSLPPTGPSIHHTNNHRRLSSLTCNFHCSCWKEQVVPWVN